jgi:glucokinase
LGAWHGGLAQFGHGGLAQFGHGSLAQFGHGSLTRMETLLGIDLGGTKIAAAAVQDGNIVAKVVVPTPKDGADSVFAAMIEAAKEVLKTAPANRVGVGVPGPLDFKKGEIKFAPNISGMINAPVVAALSAGLGLPVELENDANAAGLAEHTYGAGRGVSSSYFITISTGIGGGIIINDRVWRGANGIAGEIGHVIALPGGVVAGSGVSGALEAVASGTAMARDASYAFARPVDTRELFDLAKQGEFRALKIVDQAARYIGNVIADLQKNLDPELFILGGGVSEVGDFFLDKIRAVAVVEARGFAEPVIRKALLGSDAGVIGAALAARE